MVDYVFKSATRMPRQLISATVEMMITALNSLSSYRRFLCDSSVFPTLTVFQIRATSTDVRSIKYTQPDEKQYWGDLLNLQIIHVLSKLKVIFEFWHPP